MSQNILNHPLFIKRRDSQRKCGEWFDDEKLAQDKFCIMPFVNIILEPDGGVGFCRHKGTEFTLGNIKDNSIEEIWNGERVRAWRKEFINQEPKICQSELKNQQCNLCPELNKMAPRATFTEELNFPPMRLTANLNGKCNLECQMCHVWKLPNGVYQEENFWKPGREKIFPFLEEIDMLSGEPLIQQDTYKLIGEVSLVNPSCLWSITTNAHWKLNKKIKSSLDKVKIKNLILSVDSFDEIIYPKIRVKGNLNLVLKTIEDLREYEKERIEKQLTPLNMNLNFLVQKDNWRELGNAIDYCLDRNIHPFMTFCYEPLEYSLLSLELNERIEILNFYVENLSWAYLSLIRRITSPLIESLPLIEKKKILLRLKEAKDNYESQSLEDLI